MLPEERACTIQAVSKTDNFIEAWVARTDLQEIGKWPRRHAVSWENSIKQLCLVDRPVWTAKEGM